MGIVEQGAPVTERRYCADLGEKTMGPSTGDAGVKKDRRLCSDSLQSENSYPSLVPLPPPGEK